MPRPSKKSRIGKLTYLKGKQKLLKRALREKLCATAGTSIEPTDVNVAQVIELACSHDKVTDQEKLDQIVDSNADQEMAGAEARVDTANQWLTWTDGADKKGRLIRYKKTDPHTVASNKLKQEMKAEGSMKIDQMFWNKAVMIKDAKQ